MSFIVGVVSSMGSSLQARVTGIVAAFEVYDKANSIMQAARLLAAVATGGEWNVLEALALSVEFIPFGKMGKRLNKLMNGVSGIIRRADDSVDALRATGRYADDIVHNPFMEKLDEIIAKAQPINRSGSKTAMKEFAGSSAASAMAIVKEWQPTYFRLSNTGLDGLFRDKFGRFVVVEAKGGADVAYTVAGGQMGQKWIKDNLEKVYRENLGKIDANVLAELRKAIDQENVVGAVIKANVNDAANMVESIAYEFKDWVDIPATSWR